MCFGQSIHYHPISTPAFSPFLLGTVPHNEIRNVVTLNGVALNIRRGIGSAIGGVLVATIEPAVTQMHYHLPELLLFLCVLKTATTALQKK
jgi:Transmembrane secretion effector